MEKWREPFTLAVDLHGVIETYPDLYKAIMYNLLMTRVKVYVLSGAPEKQVQEELAALGYVRGIHYTEILSVVDWLQENGVPMYQNEKGHWWTEHEEDWWSSKAKMCNEFAIDILIDDREEYAEHLHGKYPQQFFHTRSIVPLVGSQPLYPHGEE